jgi:hypothetical protein
MKKFLVLTSLILLLAFVTTSLFSIAFNTNLKRDAHAVENTYSGFLDSFLFKQYFPQENYHDGPQNNPSPFVESYKLLLLGVGLIVLSLIGRKTLKS